VLVKPGDAQSLADALTELLSDESSLVEAERKSAKAALRFIPREVSRPLAQWLEHPDVRP
jgi:glycosyltransferase involved in cell wall biosynthesis